MFRFDVRSFLISMCLFIVLVFIAMYVTDQIIRPFWGDVLVVIWLFYLAQSVLSVSKNILILCTLAFAYCVEFTQYFQLIKWAGLEHINWIRIVLGATFDLYDLLAYTLGALAVFTINTLFRSKKK